MGRVRIYNLGFAVFSLALGHPRTRSLPRREPARCGSCSGDSSRAWAAPCCSPTRVRSLSTRSRRISGAWRWASTRSRRSADRSLDSSLGGLLSVVDWRLVFWVSVPFGIIGTIWGYHSLRDNGKRATATIDWWGNLTFARRSHVDPRRHRLRHPALFAPLHGVDVAPGAHRFVIGVVFLIAFFIIENWVESPMFNLRLFKIRAFSTGSAAGFLAAISRGGLQFMLIIWLQGIWLPLHGYAYSATPLWAGIYLLPLTTGFLFAGPDFGLPLGSSRCTNPFDLGIAGLRSELRRTLAGADQFPAIGSSRSWSS